MSAWRFKAEEILKQWFKRNFTTCTTGSCALVWGSYLTRRRLLLDLIIRIGRYFFSLPKFLGLQRFITHCSTPSLSFVLFIPLVERKHWDHEVVGSDLSSLELSFISWVSLVKSLKAVDLSLPLPCESCDLLRQWKPSNAASIQKSLITHTFYGEKIF